MPENDRSIVQWSAVEPVVIPAHSDPAQIVAFGRPQLSQRDMRSIVAALHSESYEMVATFVWAKASAVLKKQLATLGMEFVGEMLGRADVDEDSDPSTSISDHEALSLAEDLAIITPTQGLRLKHALELVTHFTNLEQPAAEEEMLSAEEAMMLLKTCIASILSRPHFDAAIKFADFRRALIERTLRADDGDVIALTQAPYFFVRTTLSVLLSVIKTAVGAAQEHALGNLSLLLPMLWERIREPEKWQVGQAYAVVNAEGNRAASTGLKRSLLKVHGFDFVPETLRSSTFSESAARVLTAHYGFNNFTSEEEPMRILANLGTAIPRPAFAKCMEAALAVWLGNYWGNSWAAGPYTKKVFESLRVEQWEYYFNECLRRDRTVLDKIASDDKPVGRWIQLIRLFDLENCTVHEERIRQLLRSSASGNVGNVKAFASALRAIVTA
jgi:hypothetical protein